MIQFLILFICITLDSFIYMLEKGATIHKTNIKYRLIYSLVFACMNVLMFLVGKGFGSILLANSQLKFQSFIRFIILFSICLLAFITTFKRKDFIERLDSNFNIKESIKHAFITSIDTSLIGTYFALLQISIPSLLFLVFVITLIMIFSAITIGHQHGATNQNIIGYFTSIIYFVFAMMYLFGFIN